MRRFILTFMAAIGLLTSFGQGLESGKSHKQGNKATQSIIVNEGTSLVSQAPFYGLFCDYGTRTQFIIPASSLTQINGDTITGLTFFSSNTSGKTWDETFHVELCEVNETTFTNPSTFYLTDLTNVFTGELSLNTTGELIINFSTNYIYQGGNLLVSVGTPGMQNGVGGSVSFYGVSTSNVGTYGYNSSGSAGQYNNLPTTTNGMVSIAPKTKITYLSDSASEDPEDPEPDECTTEDFSGYSASSAISAGVLPTGWVGFTPNGSSSNYAPHVSNSSYASINGNYLIFVSSSSTPSSIAIMPQFEDDIISVEFDYCYESTSNGTLSVGYVTANTLAGCNSYVQLASFSSTTSVTHFALTQAQINQINENEGYIAFKFTNSGSLWYTAGIDNLEICVQTCPPSYSTQTHTACDSFTWIDGVTYTESNNTAKYILEGASVTGCDSIIKLDLTINHGEENSYSVLTCEPYEWHGATYVTSGTYEYDGTTALGCPLHETLELDIEESIPVDIYASACESYTWADGDGQTYTQTGVYPYTYSTSACDTTIYLNLTVYHTETLEPEVVTACESYEWFGVTYTVDGVYTHITQLGAGCVRTETLDLTIVHNETAIPELVEICDSYEWYDSVYTESGVYTHDIQTEAGCIRTETINLVIFTTEEVDLEPVLACDSYEWYGETYTESGTYTHASTLSGGCVLTENLELTIVNAVHSETSVTTCDEYIWNGQTFNEEGDYEVSFASSVGCDSIVTLHLTLLHSVSNEFEVETCDSYTWNTVNYGNSGDYHQIFASAAGCDSVVTLHLTLKNSTSFEFDAEECPGYVWNDQTYDTDGDYTQYFVGANGCDSVVTMHLTVKDVPTSQFVVDTCEMYVWDGVEYYETGLYYNTYEAANGCDSIVTMVLHVYDLPTVILGGEFWVAEGVRDSTTLWAWGGSSYLWSTGDTTRYLVVAPEHDTTYYITVFNIWGCSTTDSITVVNATGVRESSINLEVYPNPVKHVLNIEATEIRSLRISDMLGQVLYTKETFDDNIQIDMSPYAQGTYLLHVTTSQGTATRKIFKQ